MVHFSYIHHVVFININHMLTIFVYQKSYGFRTWTSTEFFSFFEPPILDDLCYPRSWRWPGKFGASMVPWCLKICWMSKFGWKNGLVQGKIYRKPWFLPSNIGLSCKFSHHPILWNTESSSVNLMESEVPPTIKEPCTSNKTSVDLWIRSKAKHPNSKCSLF